MIDQVYVRADSGSAVLEALQALLGDRISTSMAMREQHGRGEDYFKPVPSDAVCFPHSTEEVSEIVKICADNHTPVIPFGTGTSLEGHVTAPHGG
ncbi:MAG: FAD-binding protein, partial [Alphaproteobacteria bacterium]|nr:FAD-binding protein [Alphaproteobacteria bacterium]